MITLTFSIVVILQMCSIANQVHYFHCQQWAHLEEIQLHAKDNNLLCSICPFQSQFVVASMIGFIHPRLIHTKLCKPTLLSSILDTVLIFTCAVRKGIPTLNVHIADPLTTLPMVVLRPKCFLSALSVKLLPNLYGLVHIFSFLSWLSHSLPSISIAIHPCLYFVVCFWFLNKLSWARKWVLFILNGIDFFVVSLSICFIFHKKLFCKESVN